MEAGCDEVGRGCLAGPVVAAAVILPKGYKNEWLNDSKKMTSKKRRLAEEQIKKDALAWAVAEVSAEEIDKSNILKASFLAMHRALDQLKLRPEFLLIDGNRFVAYQELPHECVVKGDGKFLSIAAASVLAKNYRDDLMAGLGEEFPHYGWASNAGYPTTAHRQAIREHGPSKWHRMSFKLLPDPTLFD